MMSKRKLTLVSAVIAFIIVLLTGFYFWSGAKTTKQQIISDLKEFKIPNIQAGDDLVYQAPKGTGFVEVRYSGDDWVSGQAMRQTFLDKLHNIYRIPISELGYKPGRYRFKFVCDGQFEDGFDRVVYVDDQGNWKRPDETQPRIEYLSETSDFLRIKDESANFLEVIGLGGDWETRIPLTYNDSKGLWELETSDLDQGIHRFKVVKNGVVEGSVDRIIRITQGGRVLTPNPRWAKIRESKSPTDTLVVDAPGTTFLAFKGSFDNWAKEYPLSPTDDGFILDLKNLNLPEGLHEIKFINSDGYEPTLNHLLYINKEQKIYFPDLNNLEIVKQQTPSNILQVKGPPLKSLNLLLSENDWKRFHEMKFNNGLWEVALDGLKPGAYEFKLQPNGNWETSNNRPLIVDEKGILTYPVNVAPKITALTKSKIKIQAPENIKLGIKSSLNWDKEIPATYNKQENIWEIKVDDLNLNTTRPNRVMFKLVLNGEFEEGPNRVMIVEPGGKITITKLSQPNNIKEETEKPNQTMDNFFFGKIRQIKPNKELSMTGKKNWYDTMRIYHLWVKSFKDSRSGKWASDNIGDLRGIREAINEDFFSKIGVNTIWLSPIFSSKGEGNPTASMHGYDVMDAYKINVNYGDLEEFKSLLKEAHAKGLRVMLDIVPNHVSREHPWFVASNDPNHPEHQKYKDYFIWLTTPSEGWKKRQIYGYEPLTFSKERNQYYYGAFGSYLPDLNYNNPEVRRELINNLIYWFNMGVDGMRIDAIIHTYEPMEEEDSPKRNHKDNILLYREIFRTVEAYDAMGYPKLLMGENYTWNLAEVELYGRERGGQAVDASVNFAFTELIKEAITKGKGSEIGKHLKDSQAKNLIYPRFISNHDGGYSRPMTAYGPIGARMAAMLSILNPEPAILYYGEEIGMEGDNKEHENLRQPYSWEEFNKQQNDPNSLLTFYKEIIEIRDSFSSNFSRKNLELVPSKVYDTKLQNELDNNATTSILYKGDTNSLLAVYNFYTQPIEIDVKRPKGIEGEVKVRQLLTTSEGEASITTSWSEGEDLKIPFKGQGAVLLELEGEASPKPSLDAPTQELEEVDE